MQILFVLYSIEYTTTTIYLMFKLINLAISLQIFTHFEFDAYKMFQKKLVRGNKTQKVVEW